MAGKQRRAAHGDHPVVEQLADLKAPLLDPPVPDADVVRIRIGRQRIGVHPQRQVHVRVAIVEVAEPRNQPRGCEVGHHAQFEPHDAVFARPRRIERAAQIVEAAAHAVRQLRAGGGRHHPAARAPEQLDAQFGFERAQMMADRAVRQMQFFGSAGKTAMARGGFQRAQRLQWRKRTGHDVKFYSQSAAKSLAGIRRADRQ